MNLPVEVFISAAAMLGAAIGYLVCAFFCGAKRSRIEKDAWNQARIFYTRRMAEQRRGL